MKKFISFICIFLILFTCTFSASAADGDVIYSGDSGEFIFAPGSDYSLTDLFANFKDVMPGDSIENTITVKNDASKKVKVKIYLRSLGAHEESAEFLSKLSLKVEKTADNEMDYMFDAAANESAQLTEWVLLGTLYSGGEVNLNVILEVPAELDNSFQKYIGYIDWEFMIEEEIIESTDPLPPQTGDYSSTWIWVTVASVSLVLFIILIIIKKKKNND